MPTSTRGTESSTYRSPLTRALSSYWVERVLFVGGCLLIFLSEQVFSGYVSNAREDVTYYERNIAQIQTMDVSRGHWLAEYNRSVAMRPQIRELVAQSAYGLFSTTDQLLSTLRAVVEHDGRGQVLSIIEEKNARRRAAERELESGNAEALVARVNNIHHEHEQHVEGLTARLMLKRQDALADESKRSTRLKRLRLFGTILLAAAFLLREVREYRRKRAEARATCAKSS